MHVGNSVTLENIPNFHKKNCNHFFTSTSFLGFGSKLQMPIFRKWFYINVTVNQNALGEGTIIKMHSFDMFF